MAEAKEGAKKKGKSKKYMGLSGVEWGAIGAGGIVIYLYLKKRAAAKTAAASSGLSDGQTTTGDTTTNGATSSAAPTTLAGWINDAIASATNATYTSSDALNDINDWLSGQCISSAGFTAIGNIVSTLGVPPGYSTTPPLTVCTGSDTSGGGDTSTGDTTGSTSDTGDGGDTGTTTGTTGSTSTGITTSPNVDPVVNTAITQFLGAPSAYLSLLGQGQNTIQAFNNTNAVMPALTTDQQTQFTQQTGISYPGPTQESAAFDQEAADQNAGLLASLNQEAASGVLADRNYA